MFVMCCSDGSQWPAKQQNTSSSSSSSILARTIKYQLLQMDPRDGDTLHLGSFISQ